MAESPQKNVPRKNVSQQLQREKADPTEADHPLPPFILLLIGGLTVFAVQYITTDAEVAGFGGDQRSAQLPSQETTTTASGPQLYTTYCGTCHQASGGGVPKVFPPLAGSSWLTQDLATPIRIVLKGLMGPIEVSGTTYNNYMAPLGHLDDASIAKVLTYVRSSWGNQASAVDPEDVAAIRAQLAARSEAFQASELATMRK